MTTLSCALRCCAAAASIASVVATALIAFNSSLRATDEQSGDLVACALTFDDGPGNYTEQLLAILKEKKVLATFFVVGEMVLRRPQTVRRIAAEGHEVDNHSFDHPDLKHLSYSQQKAEIEKTDRALRELGIVPKYFRPPYGSYDPSTVRAAAQNGLVLMLWTDDALDWKYHSGQSLERYLDRRLKRKVGGIYLFHDLHSWTVKAMPEIISDLTRHGCRFVTLDEYMLGKTETGTKR
jgi:peptidoglycan/xylan/chitin deacetylase (PgdA/CDA1 family)